MSAMPHESPGDESSPARHSHEMADVAARLMQLIGYESRTSSESGGASPAGAVGNVRSLGKSRKVSVSMPEGLTAAIQQRVGRGEFSQYVTDAVARQLELDLLAELADLLEAEDGPVTEDALSEAKAAWPDAE